MKLRDFVRLHRQGDVAKMAADLTVSEGTLYKYMAGSVIPGRLIMRRIVRVTGGAVTPNDFYDVTLVV